MKSLEEMQQEHPFPLWDVLKALLRKGPQAVSNRKQTLKRSRVRRWMRENPVRVEEIRRRRDGNEEES